jgi:hypothetical protein
MHNIKTLIMAITYGVMNCLTPAPILLMNFISILFVKYLIRREAIIATLFLSIIMLIFVPFHYDGVVSHDGYILSFIAFIFIFFTSVSIALYVANYPHLEFLIKSTTIIVGAVFIFSTIILIIFGDSSIAGGWYEHNYTSGSTIFRYGGFLYEASYFGLMLVPLIFYFWNQGLDKKGNFYFLISLLLMATATFSVGFFVTFFISIFVAKLMSEKRISVLWSLFVYLLTALVLFFLAYSLSEAVSLRIDNILSGGDSSTGGRTLDAYYLAFNVADKNSIFFGVGPGQIKFVGHDLIIDYYNYDPFLHSVVRIPSSLAETLAYYGFLGIVLKIVALIFLYLKFGVYSYRFSNGLFLFFFVYQFYGSFMLSALEIFCFALSFAMVSRSSIDR